MTTPKGKTEHSAKRTLISRNQSREIPHKSFKEKQEDMCLGLSDASKLIDNSNPPVRGTEEIFVSPVQPKNKENEKLKSKKEQKAKRKRRFHKQSARKENNESQNIRFTRRLWTDEEDVAITALVQRHGIRKWTLISRKLQDQYAIYGRSGKQCRER